MAKKKKDYKIIKVHDWIIRSLDGALDELYWDYESKMTAISSLSKLLKGEKE